MLALNTSSDFENVEKSSICFFEFSNDATSRKNPLRRRLDALGHASLEVYSLEDLLVILRKGMAFKCLLIAMQDEDMKLELKEISNSSNIPLLLVAPLGLLNSMIDVNGKFPEFKKLDIVCPSCNDEELKLRIEMLSQQGEVFHRAEGKLISGEYRFDSGSNSVWMGDQQIHLKPREFILAFELFKNINLLIPREKISVEVWKKNIRSSKSRPIDVCVSNVRKKLKLIPENGYALRAIYGQGYSLVKLG